MALGLIARGSVAISDTLNSWYRVWKGTDPESVYLRLPTAGSFEVRHSVTNAPVFRVTDAGMVGGIDGSNIADGTVGTSELANSAVTSAKILDGSIVNADVSPSANIVPSKLWGGGTADRVLGTPDGTVVAPVLVSSAMIADGAIVNADVSATAAIAYSKLALAASITSNDIVDGAIVNADVNAAAAIAYSKLALAASITSNDIVDGTLVNADVNAAAGIAITKLADVGANNVLRSSGAGNVAGKIVTNDMVINTINGDRILDASIVGAKITGGAPPPNGTGVPDAYKVYATGPAGTTVSLQQVVTQMLAANAATKVTISPALATAAVVATTPVNLYDLTVVTGGGTLLAFFVGYAHNNTAACSTYLGISFDGGVFQVGAGWHQPAASPGYDQGFSGLVPLGVPGAGTHHVVLQWYVSAGQTNIGAGWLVVVELLR